MERVNPTLCLGSTVELALVAGFVGDQTLTVSAWECWAYHLFTEKYHALERYALKPHCTLPSMAGRSWLFLSQDVALRREVPGQYSTGCRDCQCGSPKGHKSRRTHSDLFHGGRVLKSSPWSYECGKADRLIRAATTQESKDLSFALPNIYSVHELLECVKGQLVL